MRKLLLILLIGFCSAQTLNMRVTTANYATSANYATTAGSATYLNPTPSILVTSNYTGVVTFNSQVNANINGRITYNATYWDDMRVDSTAIKLAGIKDPGFAAFAATTVYTYHFDDTTIEEVFFECQVSHEYKPGTTMNVHVHFSPDTTNTGNVAWGLDYIIADINTTFNTPAVTITTNATIASNSQYRHLLVDFTPSIPTKNGPSQMIIGRLYRNATDGTYDTLTGDVSLLSLDFHYQKDSPGSRGIVTK